MEKTTGLVIKCKDYSETSQLVWMYTKDFGKIKVIAKGSRKKIKIDLFNLCEVVFYKSRGELHTLSEYSILETFSGIREDLNKLATASYMAELVDASTGLEDPSSEAYSLVTSVFGWLAVGRNPEFLRYIFEIKLMQVLGNFPKIDNVSKGLMKILESKAIDKLKISASQLEELKNISRLIVDYSVPKELKSINFLKEVERYG